MLQLRSHCRNAFQQSPEKEARLLYVNSPQQPAPNQPQGPNTPAVPAAPNTPAAPATPNTPANPTTPAPVNQNRNNTREQVNEALTTPEEALTAANVLREVNETHDMMLSFADEMEKMSKEARDAGGKFWSEWQINLHTLRKETQNALMLRNIADSLRMWESGQLSPDELIPVLEHLHSYERGNAREFENIDSRIILEDVWGYIRETQGRESGNLRDGQVPDITTSDKWQQLNNPTRQQAIRDINGLAGISEKLMFIRLWSTSMKEALQEAKIQDMVEATKKQATEDAQQAEGEGEQAKSLTGALGIEFFTIKQMLGGAKRWWEAYKKVLQGHDDLKTAHFAKKVGRMFGWVPYGDEAERVLDEDVDAQNRKIKNDYKEYLSERSFGFRDTFIGPQSILRQSSADANRAMAVLEYAAGRGWLYKLQDQRDAGITDIGRLTIFDYNLRSLLPSDWDTNRIQDYVKGLESANSKGIDAETSKFKERESMNNNFDAFVSAFDREMNNLNFWAARGVLQAAHDAGKDGTTNTRMMAIFFRKMSERPEIRRYMSKTVLDKFGGHAWTQATFTPAFLTMEKDKIANALSRDTNNIAEYGEQLGPVIAQIHTLTRQRGGGATLKQTDIDDIVAKVLAGMTPEIGKGGPKISIFENNAVFRNYREHINAASNGTIMHYFDGATVAKQSNTYFVNETEIILQPAKTISELLSTNTAGIFGSGNAIPTLSQIVYRMRDLMSNPQLQGAAENFRREMKPKLESGLIPGLKNKPSVMLTHGLDGFNQDTPAIATLYALDLIGEDMLRDAGGEDLVKSVQAQARTGKLATMRSQSASGGAAEPQNRMAA